MGILDTIAYFIFAFFWGVLCTILVEMYLFKKYLYSGPVVKPPKSPWPPGHAELPEELLSQIANERSSISSSSPRHNLSQGSENLAINLTLQFLFNELRNAERVRLWFIKKLNNEFKELLTQSTTGKFFESAQLRDLNLGNHFPTIKGLDVADAKISADTGLLETLDLSLDLHYSGNFQMSVDLKMVLGKSAHLSLQVKRLTGKARLQFTRVPYTHWSLSFYSEPVLELEVNSQFQGRQLQPQIISLITSQIRRAVRRKHTLPRYKIRYKPFFRRLNDEDFSLIEAQSIPVIPSYLDVTLIEVSRLNIDPALINNENLSQIEIYCTMSVDYTPWVYLTQYNGVPYMVLDLIISKENAQQLGVVFKQDIITEIGQNCILVENIVSGSPAGLAEMKKGDIVVAINNKKVSSMNHVAKLLKSTAQRRFIVRVERKYSLFDVEKGSPCRFELDKYSEKTGSRKTLYSDSLNFSDETRSVKYSDLKDSDIDSTTTITNTTTTMYPTTDKNESSSRLFKRRKSSSLISEDGSQIPDTPSRQTSYTSLSSCISNCAQPYSQGDCNMISLNELYYTTTEKDYSSVITFDEKTNFNIESDLQYLNIGIWAKIKEIEKLPKLLGYLNIPIKLIQTRCATSINGHYLKCHPLLPPDSALSVIRNCKLNGYSGFDPSLCYGDVLISYEWVSCRPKQTVIENKKNVEETLSNKVQAPITGDVSKKPHDFIRTHFHRATHCDFCTKKIWLKDAVQCRNCGMVCHKKCEIRCQAAGPCTAETLTGAADEADEPEMNVTIGNETGPEISLTTACDDNYQGARMTTVKASIANTLLGLKKAGSTSCLAPPNSGSGMGSRSLPPSPCTSRKNSLVSDLGISADLLEGAESSIASTLIAGELNDGLMSKAKETGKFLFDNLQPQERVDKINCMILKLNTALDTETASRVELSLNNDAENHQLIVQSDRRVQALSVLLLHYCNGLQHAQSILNYSSENIFSD